MDRKIRQGIGKIVLEVDIYSPDEEKIKKVYMKLRDILRKESVARIRDSSKYEYKKQIQMYRGIDYIRDTHIKVWEVVKYGKAKDWNFDLLDFPKVFPELTIEDIIAVKEYYLDSPSTVDLLITYDGNLPMCLYCDSREVELITQHMFIDTSTGQQVKVDSTLDVWNCRKCETIFIPPVKPTNDKSK